MIEEQLLGIDGPGQRCVPFDHQATISHGQMWQSHRPVGRFVPHQSGQQDTAQVMGDPATAWAARGQQRFTVAKHDGGRHGRHRPATGPALVGHWNAGDAGLEGEVGELVVHHHAGHQMPAAENGFH